ncbi:YkvA family protein [Selenomonas ruminantium]|uniref:YkvA family protein n=1 Tax=Selenomonas ruminantium TaxID=971 RepID=UPI0026F371C3|nr:DUF1232 domain-containing protein [Selenomonas ruminantium]
MNDSNKDIPLTDNELGDYSAKYSEKNLWDKIAGNVQSIGAKLIYNALQLYYATENPACPQKVKLGIYAALGYLISPIDFIPDFTPIAGYGDDASAIGTALLLAQMYIDDEVREKAKTKMVDLFGEKIITKI